MVIIDELSFKFVKGSGFKQFVDLACPMFKIPSRWTVNRDVFSIFFEEKTNLKKLFKENTQRMFNHRYLDICTKDQLYVHYCIFY